MALSSPRNPVRRPLAVLSIALAGVALVAVGCGSWRSGVLPFFSQGATRAVRRPESSECSTQPSAPSESRMRRQISNSATISTGRPARWNTQRVR